MDKLLNVVERVSLVKLSSREKSIRLLTDSIKSAEQLSVFRGSDIKPLITLCNEEPWRTKPASNQVHSLLLRKDEAIPLKKQDILSNASHLIEGYFVTPNNAAVIEAKS